MVNFIKRILTNRKFLSALFAVSCLGLISQAAFDVSDDSAEVTAETKRHDREVKLFDWAAIRKPDARDHVALYVNRTFRIPIKDADSIVGWAVESGEKFDLDPLLILAVIGTESSYNANAKSGAGAEGLMQVMTRVHKEKFETLGGLEMAFDPKANINVGSDILRGLIRRTGSVRKGLKWYCGAANHKTDGGYADRVLNELSRLQEAADGNVDNAVTLNRKKKTGPVVESGLKGEPLGFSRWAENEGNRAVTVADLGRHKLRKLRTAVAGMRKEAEA